MAPKPITDAERARIAELARGGMARNDIAREVRRSPSTVSKIAHAAGLTFDRQATAAATAAKQADNRARRASLIEGMYDDALRLRRQLWEATILHSFGGKDHTHNSIELPEPTFADKRNIAQAVRQLADGAAGLEKIDQGGAGTEEATSMLAGIAAGLAAAHQAAQADPPAADADP